MIQLRIQIQDRIFLETITPQHMHGLLRGFGFSPAHEGTNNRVWLRAGVGILAPSAEDTPAKRPNYAQVVELALDDVARSEGQSVLALLDRMGIDWVGYHGRAHAEQLGALSAAVDFSPLFGAADDWEIDANADYLAALARIDVLMGAAPHTPEMAELLRLTLAVESYEKTAFPIGEPAAEDAADFRNDQEGGRNVPLE